MKKIIATIFVMAFSACKPPVDPMKVEVLPLENKQHQQSYALGASVGQITQDKVDKQQQLGIEYDQALIVKGFIAALQGQSQLDKTEVLSITRAIESQAKDINLALKAQQGETNKAEGVAFLESNRQRKGILETTSGLQYEILKSGKGTKPKTSDTVKVHYRGTLLNGTEFDSSYSRNSPSTFPLTRVIKGWTEGLQLMSPGAKYKFYIPSNLAYGARDMGKITAHSTLIFEIELLEIVDTHKPALK